MSYKEKIYQNIKQAYREKNAEMAVYYKNALIANGCEDFKKFEKTYAYSSWVLDNIDKIETVKKEMGIYKYV